MFSWGRTPLFQCRLSFFSPDLETCSMVRYSYRLVQFTLDLILKNNLFACLKVVVSVVDEVLEVSLEVEGLEPVVDHALHPASSPLRAIMAHY